MGSFRPRVTAMSNFLKKFVLCGLLLGALASVSCSSPFADVNAEYRKFTDKRGKTLMAKVVNVSKTEVTLQRRDGKSVTVKIGNLSLADQEFLRNSNPS